MDRYQKARDFYRKVEILAEVNWLERRLAVIGEGTDEKRSRAH